MTPSPLRRSRTTGVPPANNEIGIQFGTAGLRGRMAAGFSCMNCLTVIQASQGLAKYIKDKHAAIAPGGVVIGHDARHNSDKFAALAANAFVSLGIPVWFYSPPSITPSVPFGVTHLRAAAGIMVTASHVRLIQRESSHHGHADLRL